jgi:universal stress protein A
MAAAKPARRILAAIDFSPRSQRVLRYAAALAEMSGGEVAVLHVIPGPATGDPERTAWTERAMTTLREELRGAGLDPSTGVHVLHGGVAEEIGRFACEHRADLLLLAGRAKPGWNGSWLGGTAETILRHARMPVLVLPGASRTPAA